MMPKPGFLEGGREVRRKNAKGEWTKADERSRHLKAMRERFKKAQSEAKARQYRSLRLQASAEKPDLGPYLQYFSDPVWGDSETFAGGTSMSVALGPEAGQRGNYGSEPVPGVCTAVEALNGSDVLAAYGWIKGHLLNDNLGGTGRDSKNLTPLTTAANKDHNKKVEEKIKNFIEMAYSETLYNEDDPYVYGVFYHVQVGEEKWGDDRPLSAVARTITCRFCPIRMVKASPGDGFEELESITLRGVTLERDEVPIENKIEFAAEDGTSAD